MATKSPRLQPQEGESSDLAGLGTRPNRSVAGEQCSDHTLELGELLLEYLPHERVVDGGVAVDEDVSEGDVRASSGMVAAISGAALESWFRASPMISNWRSTAAWSMAFVR
jgi:hypothetical protein